MLFVTPSNEEAIDETEINELSTAINNIKIAFTDNLNNLTEINSNMKIQAKQYYDQYKELKKAFIQERLQLNEEKKLIQEYESKIALEKEKVEAKIEEDLREKVFLKNKIGIQNSLYYDQDIDDMIEILNTLKFENDLYKGLSDKEVSILKFVLNKYKFSKNEEDLVHTFKESYKNEEEENLINKIEDTVNHLMSENKIGEFKIKQISNCQFQFNNYVGSLILDNGVLKVKETLLANANSLSTPKVNNKEEVKGVDKLDKLDKPKEKITVEQGKNDYFSPKHSEVSNEHLKSEKDKDEYFNFEEWLIMKFPYSQPKFLDKTLTQINSIQKSYIGKQAEKMKKHFGGKKINDLK